jgi:hypothetical protein
VSEIEVTPQKTFMQKVPFYLRREGGIKGVYYGLRLEEKGAVTEVSDARALQMLLAPIDTAAKAVTVIALTKSGLVRRDGHLIAKTSSIPEGFLVQAYDSNTFGCSNHIPTGVVFVVYKNGTTAIASKENEGSRREGYSCVD